MQSLDKSQVTPLSTYLTEGGGIASTGYSEVSRTLHIEERYSNAPSTPANSSSSPQLLIATVLIGGGLIVGLTASIAWNMALSHQNQQLINAQAENTQLKAWKGQVKTFVCN